MSLESIRQWRDDQREHFEDPASPLGRAEMVVYGWWTDVHELLEVVDAGQRLIDNLAETLELVTARADANEERVVLMAERLAAPCPSCAAERSGHTAGPVFGVDQQGGFAAPGETDQRAALVKQLVDGLRPRSPQSIAEVHVNGEPLLAPAEHLVLELLGYVWNTLKQVGDPESLDMKELALHVHALQYAVMAQASARAYPERYRLIGQPGAWRRYPEQASS